MIKVNLKEILLKKKKTLNFHKKSEKFLRKK